MDILKIIALILSSAGIWKIIELLLHFKSENRLKNAEIRNLHVQANSLVVENYKMWSEKMEKRLKQLEDKNAEMSKTIIEQRQRILDLENYVEELEKQLQLKSKKQ